MTRNIDIHCHPSLKPFGHSFKTNRPGANAKNVRNKHSVWHYDRPNFLDRLIDKLTGLTKFRQSDFTSLLLGDTTVIICSLYPLEKGFIRNKMGKGLLVDLLVNLVNGVSKKYIDHCQATDKYFEDLELEYKFLEELNGQKVNISGQKFTYKLINSLDELDPSEDTVNVFISIEGGHVFDCGYPGKKANEKTVLANVDKVKNWDYYPVFIGPAHHFYSELVGHAESITVGVADCKTNQEYMMNTGFTELGYKVVRKLLDNSNNRRIYIDIKHMSMQSRKEYYDLLKKEYGDEDIPIIMSHGAVNGKESFNNQFPVNNRHLTKLLYDKDINIFDEEIILIENSNGLFGIQIDERRICSKATKKQSNKVRGSKRKKKHAKSKLIWNQIQYIAELLDKMNLPAWDIQCIGSDYDGGIDSVNYFYTAESFSDLSNYLEVHATKFMADYGDNLKAYNQISPELIVDKFMSINVENFLLKYR